jgi:hypothetical protein
MRISAHWTLEELCWSDIAHAAGIVNDPGVEETKNLVALALYVLEPARMLLGRPMIPSSGFRCQELNAHPRIKGAPDSQHPKGEACDFVCDDMDGAFEVIAASDIPYDQLIREVKGNRNWIHISYTERHDPRRQALVIDDNGTRTYAPR